MRYYQEENTLVLTEVANFDIEQTIESGQCFRFTRHGEGDYSIIAHGRELRLVQDPKEMSKIIIKNCTEDEFENIWYNYFDLGKDYGELKEVMSKDDEVMTKCIDFAPGIRLMNQDPWECLISFIISANNRIPMIKQVVSNISREFGTRVVGSRDIYVFPTPEQMSKINIDELLECKTGFRAKYMLDAAIKITSGEISIYGRDDDETARIKEDLMTVKGVGLKVADCALLFSQGRREIFPIDVWIRRIVQELYFNGQEIPMQKLQDFARTKWGENAGFANQYLFHYARINKIGTKS